MHVVGNIDQSFSNLDSLELDDVLELLEKTQDTLDELWKQDEHKPYPEARMKHLLDIMAGNNSIDTFFLLKACAIDILLNTTSVCTSPNTYLVTLYGHRPN